MAKSIRNITITSFCIAAYVCMYDIARDPEYIYYFSSPDSDKFVERNHINESYLKSGFQKNVDNGDKLSFLNRRNSNNDESVEEHVEEKGENFFSRILSNHNTPEVEHSNNKDF